MQPLAIAALAAGIVLLLGVAAALLRTRHEVTAHRFTVNRWIRNGSLPLAGGGLAVGVISRSSGQLPATHNVLYAVTTTLLLAAVLCALIGAAVASRQGHSSGHA